MKTFFFFGDRLKILCEDLFFFGENLRSVAYAGFFNGGGGFKSDIKNLFAIYALANK